MIGWNAREQGLLTVDEHLARLRVEGTLLGDIAGDAELSAPVPGCPGWDVEALVRHIGRVHRWAGTIVRDRVTERLRRSFVGPADRDGLLAWYGEGHAELVETLSTASPDAEFWTWGEAPNAVAFWTRRQAHETGIHRLDAEQAAGLEETAFPPAVAADGIDELLMLSSRCEDQGGEGRSLRVAPTDVADRWLVELHGDGLRVSRAESAVAACTLTGPASDLFAVLMNRRGRDAVAVEGDVDVMRAWRDCVHF